MPYLPEAVTHQRATDETDQVTCRLCGQQWTRGDPEPATCPWEAYLPPPSPEVAQRVLRDHSLDDGIPGPDDPPPFDT